MTQPSQRLAATRPRPLLHPLLRALLAVGATLLAVHVIGAALDCVEVANAPDPSDSPDYDTVMSGERARLVAQLLEMLALIAFSFATVAVLAGLTARARRTAELISPRPHRLGPGLAAGGWFIPIANILLPWQAVTDIWLASDPATRHDPPNVGSRSVARVNWWWGSSIALTILSAALTLMLPQPVLTYDPGNRAILDGLDDYRSALTATAAANSLLTIGWMVVAVLTYRVFQQLADWQDAAAPGPTALVLNPLSSAERQAVGGPPTAGWRRAAQPPSGLAIALIVVVVVSALVPIQLAVTIGQILTPGGGRGPVLRFVLGSAAAVIAMITAGAMTMMWQARARTFFARVAGPAAVPASWAVAAWVIPVANLVVPAWLTYRLLRSAGAGRPAAGDVVLVAAWWIAWLGGWSSSWITVVYSFNLRVDTLMTTLPGAAWTTAGIWVVGAVLYALVVASIHHRQHRLTSPPPNAAMAEVAAVGGQARLHTNPHPPTCGAYRAPGSALPTAPSAAGIAGGTAMPVRRRRFWIPVLAATVILAVSLTVLVVMRSTGVPAAEPATNQYALPSRGPVTERTITSPLPPTPLPASNAIARLDGTPVLVTCVSELEGSMIAVIDLATGKPIGQLIKPPGVLAATATRVDGRSVVISNENMDGDIRLWDLATGKPLPTILSGHTDVVRYLAVVDLEGAPVLISGGDDGSVRRWNLSTMAPIGDPFLVQGGTVNAMEVSGPDDRPILVAKARNGPLQAWDITTGAIIDIPGAVRHSASAIETVELAGVTAVLVENSPKIDLIELFTGAPIAPGIEGDGSYGSTVAVLDDRPVIVEVSNTEIRLRDLRDGAVIGKGIPEHPYMIDYKAAVAVDGTTYLITVAADHTIRIWDLTERARR